MSDVTTQFQGLLPRQAAYIDERLAALRAELLQRITQLRTDTELGQDDLVSLGALLDSDPRLPTHDEKAALRGTVGAPSKTNPYVTKEDTSVSGPRTPTGAAGGVLSGTYPNPGFAVDMATQAELDTHTGLTTTAHGGIVASTDPRLTNARTPTAHHTSHESGGTDVIPHQSLSGAGTNTHAQIDTHIGQTTTAHGGIVASTDPRLTDARTPTTHHTSHESGGTDVIPHQSLSGSGTNTHAQIDTHIGLTTTAHGGIVASSDARLTDARAPTAHATSHKHGGSDEVATATAAANAIPKAGSDAVLAPAWMKDHMQRQDIGASETVTLASGYSLVLADYFECAGTFECSGAMEVIG